MCGRSTVYLPPTAAEERFDAICDELAELCGQQNAIAARIAELLAQIEDEGLLGGTGVRSLEHFATWQLGISTGRARNLTAIARAFDDFPVTTRLLRDGLLSEDQAAVIARRAPAGTDDHYAELARSATVSQLRTALRVAPAPEPDDTKPDPHHEDDRTVSAFWDDLDQWVLNVRFGKLEGALADTALRSHLDALVNEWRREHGPADGSAGAPMPTLADAFVRLVEHGFDAEAHHRPHGHRTTVVVHVDVDQRVGQLHLGPVLTEAERRYLTCDARFEVWFERDGVPIGAGRTTREIPRRLRRALERRAGGCCEIPGCGARVGLHAHHLWHWEDGGPTELWNLLLVCPFHHRLHHRGLITIRGPAGSLQVVDRRGRVLSGASVARSPSSAPPPARYVHPTGEAVEWRWYDPPSLC